MTELRTFVAYTPWLGRGTRPNDQIKSPLRWLGRVYLIADARLGRQRRPTVFSWHYVEFLPSIDIHAGPWTQALWIVEEGNWLSTRQVMADFNRAKGAPSEKKQFNASPWNCSEDLERNDQGSGDCLTRLFERDGLEIHAKAQESVFVHEFKREIRETHFIGRFPLIASEQRVKQGAQDPGCIGGILLKCGKRYWTATLMDMPHGTQKDPRLGILGGYRAIEGALRMPEFKIRLGGSTDALKAFRDDAQRMQMVEFFGNESIYEKFGNEFGATFLAQNAFVAACQLCPTYVLTAPGYALEPESNALFGNLAGTVVADWPMRCFGRLDDDCSFPFEYVAGDRIVPSPEVGEFDYRVIKLKSQKPTNESKAEHEGVDSADWRKSINEVIARLRIEGGNDDDIAYLEMIAAKS